MAHGSAIPTRVSGSEDIPFNRPSCAGPEYTYVREAIANGHISGDGPFTKRCHETLRNWLGVPDVLLTTSCTHALEMSALLLCIEPGDEVIIPSFTFVSTVNAFVLFGAKPVFIDVREDTLNLDERLLPEKLTDRTKAIVTVHYAGVGCEMDEVMRIAAARQVSVVEDNAHGLLGRYKGQLLGTFGRVATQSFHETKNFSCGEGGALIINDPALVDRAEIIREKGTNRKKFFRGQVDKYSWVDVGSSYLPSDILAAFLLAQLQARDAIQGTRGKVWHNYMEGLAVWAAENGIRVPHVPPHCEQPYHMFYLLMPDLNTRRRFIEHMREGGILTVFHYVPLHLSHMGQRLGGGLSDCPVTEQMSDRLVRLPFFNDMTQSEQARIIDRVLQFRC